MAKKLTKTQKMINFVWNNGPSTWTEIQMYMLDWDGTAQELYKSTSRGYGGLGVWKTATSSARNRRYYITKLAGSKYYVVYDDYADEVHIKPQHKHLIANTVHPMFHPNAITSQEASGTYTQCY